MGLETDHRVVSRWVIAFQQVKRASPEDARRRKGISPCIMVTWKGKKNQRWWPFLGDEKAI
jgi:hypothetical protein